MALIGSGVLAAVLLVGLIVQSFLTAREYERTNVCADAMDDIGMAFGNYASKHAGEYPRTLTMLVASEALSDGDKLRGPDVKVEGAEAYDYIAGLRSGDDPIKASPSTRRSTTSSATRR